MDKIKKEEKKEFDFALGKRWATGIPYEVAFWRSYYQRCKSREALLSWSQLGKECVLDNFDIVSSVRPMMVIWQALICLHVGGVLYLNHKPNEAEHEAYVGFHQYNVDSVDGKLIIWNKEERIDIGEALAEYADVKASVTDSGRIVGVITKTNNLPVDHWAVIESGAYAAGMLETLMTYFHNLPNSFSYQIKRGSFSVMHRFVRRLPGGLLRKIKTMVSGKKAIE